MQYHNTWAMMRPCAQEEKYDASWADYSRVIVPADTEVLDELGAHFS